MTHHYAVLVDLNYTSPEICVRVWEWHGKTRWTVAVFQPDACGGKHQALAAAHRFAAFLYDTHR